MSGNSFSLILQERDRRLLSALETMRVMDRGQVMAVAAFRSVTRANTRLLKLTKAGLLHRLYVGSRAGNRKALYALSRKGAAITGVRLWHIPRRRMEAILVDPTIEHQLAVNEIRIWACHRQSAQVQSVHFRSFQQPLAAAIPLTPDGYFEVQLNDRTLPQFLEVDRGTEGQKVWKKKTEAYLRFAASGEFGRRFGQPTFRVLVVAHSERRLASIRRSVARHTEKIFWFATFESINREGFWSAVWVRPTGDLRVSLL